MMNVVLNSYGRKYNYTYTLNARGLFNLCFSCHFFSIHRYITLTYCSIDIYVYTIDWYQIKPLKLKKKLLCL